MEEDALGIREGSCRTCPQPASALFLTVYLSVICSHTVCLLFLKLKKARQPSATGSLLTCSGVGNGYMSVVSRPLLYIVKSEYGARD